MVKTTILIETETRNRLRLRGIKGDTYDDIINKSAQTDRRIKKMKDVIATWNTWVINTQGTGIFEDHKVSAITKQGR